MLVVGDCEPWRPSSLAARQPLDALCYRLSPLSSLRLRFASAVVRPAYRSPSLWLAGHVRLRALANGTARNRFGSCVSLVPRAGVAALVALLVTSHKSPAGVLHVVSRVGPTTLNQ
jgi:hypothetical protein